MKTHRWGVELTEGLASRQAHQGCRVIRTARTVQKINAAADAGFFPLVKAVKPNPDVHEMVAVMQDPLTGRITLSRDMRTGYGERRVMEYLTARISRSCLTRRATPATGLGELGMKFDPATKALTADDGHLIKVLQCPRKMRLAQLLADGESGHFHCNACTHKVLDTSLLTEEQLVEHVKVDPNCCLLVRRDQHNIDIV